MAGSEVSAPVFVPSILATKTAALQSDGNGNGFVNPGEGLRYTVTVNNSGTDATGVNFNDTIDANTTIIPGSLIVSPIAVNDTYSSIGNVGINVPAASGVLTNDLNPNAAVAPSILSVNQAGLQGTLVFNNADGSFTFTPNVGFEGSTTFVYTLGNGTGLTDTATVTINVTGMIWFVNNTAAACTTIAAGCGRLSSPFSTLAAFNTANVGGGSNPDNNDNIFVYESGSGYAGAVTLRSGQKLIGQDATATLASIAGVTVPAFSSPALPAMNAANGTITNITSTVTLNNSVVMRGLSINSTTSTGINDGASAITGVSVSEASVATTTGTAVSLSDLGGAISLRSVSANGAANGIALTNTTGSFTVTGSGGACTLVTPTCTGGTIQNTTADGILLDNADNVSFTSTRILNAGRQGIFGRIIDGFQLLNSLNAGSGDGDEENAILFENDPTTANVNHTGTPLNGTFLIQDVQIETPIQWGVRFHQLNGTMNLTVTRLLVQNNINVDGLNLGEQPFTFRQESGTANVLIDDSDFLNVDSHIDGGVQGSGTLNMTVQNTVVNQSQALPFGINFVTSTSGSGRLMATGNTFTGCSGGPGQVPTNQCSVGIDLDASGTSTLEATIQNNTITDTGIGGGLEFVVNDNAIGKANIRDNNMTIATGRIGMNFQSRTVLPENNETGQLHLTIEGNTLNNIGGTSFFPGYAFATGQGGTTPTHANLMCVNLDTPAAGGNVVNGNTATDIYSYTFRQRPGTTFQIQGLTGSGADRNNIQNFINAQHGGGTLGAAPAGSDAAGSFTDVFGAGGTTIVNYSNGTCQTAATPPLPVVPPAPMDFAVLDSVFSFGLGAFGGTLLDERVSVQREKSASPVSSRVAEMAYKLSRSALFRAVIPTAYAQESKNVITKAGKEAPMSGETVTKSIGLIPASEHVVIRFDVIVDAAMPTNVYSVSNQGTVSGVGFSNVLTDDPAVAGAANPTVTSVIQAPAFTKAFSPTTVATNTGVSTLTFTLVNGNPSQALSNVAFTDTLPSGVQVTATPAATTSGCGAPTWAPAAAATNLTFSGGSVAAGATCTVTVNVRSTAEGTKNNLSSTATSTQANPSSTAAANLTVINAPTFTKVFGASSVPLNGSTSLSFTITNTSATSSLTGVGFTDTLPAGLVVATPPGTTGTCGGGTITANAGAGSITLAGATLTPSGTCTFSVNVTGTTVGVKNNTATLSTTELGIGAIASAGLNVVAPPTISNSFALGTIVTGQSTMVNIIVTNPGSNPLALTGVSFTDVLPPGVVTTTATNAQCGGTLTVTAPGNISLSSATISSGGSCAIGVPVTGAQAGNWSNTINSVSSTNGGTNNTPATAVIIVNKAGTSASITNGAALTTPTVVGEAYPVVATMSVGSPGSSSPTAPSGTITISDGSQTCLISLPGGTTCLLTSTSTGTPKNLTATYSGDTNFLASPASPNVPHTVNKAGTAIQISGDDPDPSIVGQSVSVLFNLMVTSPGAGSPSGNVTVSDGVDSCIGTVAAGQCSITLTTAGSRMLSASYSGDTSFNASISPGESHQVNLPCTTNPVVSASGDSGPGTLRQAVLDACDGNTITFAGSVAGPVTITSGQIAINRNLTILGPSGGLTVSGNNSTRLFEVANGANLTIGRLTLSGGSSTSGAAFYVNPNCTLNLSDSTISGNSASVEGGGVYNDGGVVNLTSSTVSSNAGGLSGGGVSNNRGVVTLVNSTISGNSATGGIGGSGGGVFNTGTLNLTHTTITNNSVGAVGSGLFNGNGIVNIRNSVVAANSGSSSSADVAGAFVSTGYNLIGNVGLATGFSAVGDQVGSFGSPLNPLLAPLAMNGGLSPTHSISSPLSPLIDKGHSFGLAVDQRGLLRPLDLSFPNAPGGDGADIGAFETPMPTAAAVTLSGRVLTPEGRGVRNASVWLTDSQNVTRRVRTGAFGQYLFVNINAGESYVVGVSSRRFGFDPRVIQINEDLFGIDFVGIELVGQKQ